MQWLVRHRSGLVDLVAIALPLGVAGLLVPVRANFASPASSLVLVAVIVAVAVVGNRVSGYLASISSTVWFDFFLTRPYQRFTITHRPDIETAVSLFVVGVVVTELAARNRHHHRSATEESDYVGLIHDLAELAVSGASADDVIERTRVELVSLLALRSCRFDPEPAARPVARLEHDGRVIHAGLWWRVDQMGLPGPEVELLVQRWGRPIGRFVLVPTPGELLGLQRRVVAVALADQVGAVLAPRLRSA